MWKVPSLEENNEFDQKRDQTEEYETKKFFLKIGS